MWLHKENLYACASCVCIFKSKYKELWILYYVFEYLLICLLG